MDRYTPSTNRANSLSTQGVDTLSANGNPARGSENGASGFAAGSALPKGTGFGETPDEAPGEANNLLRLLQTQSQSEYERLLSQSEMVTLERGAVLVEPGETIRYVYFPESAVASLIKVLSDDRRIEVGTAGMEGMAGLPVFLGADSVPVLCVIQVSGTARRLTATTLRELASHDSALHGILQRYAQYVFDQAAQSVACNWLHAINERCARWLLMTHDRVDGDQFVLTHEYLATMLGARRAGVSEAAEALQKAGLIRYSRGKMSITDRAGLERASCECYASDRADYERLLSRGGSARAGGGELQS